MDNPHPLERDETFLHHFIDNQLQQFEFVRVFYDLHDQLEVNEALALLLAVGRYLRRDILLSQTATGELGLRIAVKAEVKGAEVGTFS